MRTRFHRVMSGARAEDGADIVVAGGGPAGTAVAYRLAKLGYDVRLVAGPPRVGADRLEILPPGVAALADALPLAAALAQAGEPLRQKWLCWSGAPESLGTPAGTHLVRRALFDAALLNEGRKAGVRVMAPATAGHARRDRGAWVVPVQGGGGVAIRTRFFADATGRVRGLLGGGSLPATPPTLAIAARWSVACPAAAALMVEAARDGWCWGAAAVDGMFESTVFVDAAAETKQTRATLVARHMDMLRETSLFAPMLRHARLLRTWVCDATPRAAAACVGADWIKIGDAALAADPLSSQGVQAALRSGLQAAAVINTVLSGGDDASAIAFYRNTLALLSHQQTRVAAELYGATPGGAHSAFWRQRQANPAPYRPALRLAAETMVVRAEAAAIGAQPALLGDRIGLVPAIHLPAQDRPAGWLNGLPVGILLGDLDAPRKAGDVAHAWSALMPPDEAWWLLALLAENGAIRISSAT
jgi:flavin-dependent dehydrogenase